MTKTFKKSLALILSVIMLMSVMPMSLSLAATYGEFEYSTSGTNATITKYNGSAAEVEVPDTITVSIWNSTTTYTVTTIGNSNNNGRPFQNKTTIEKVTLGNNVQTIGTSAFSGCTNLETIVIPKSLTTVNRSAFNNCNNLTTVNYKGSPEDWAKITISTTGNSSLTNATINYYYGHNCSTDGHVTQKVNGTPATCTEPGVMDYWKCLVCEANFADQAATQILETTVINASGHSWAETLTQGEESHYIVCTVIGCGATKEDTIEAHNWEDATCTAPKTCADCQKTDGNANGHDWAEEWTIGETEHYKECTVDGCDAKYGTAEHSFADATCTAPKTCTVCQKTEGVPAEHVQGTPNGGGEYDYFYDAPTCDSEGYHTAIICINCHETLEAKGVIPATGHKFETVLEEVPPTCEEAGYILKECSNAGCDETKAERPAALEHDFPEVWEVEKAATCTNAGLEYRICMKEGCGERENKIVEAYNHVGREQPAVTENPVPGTCATNATYETVVYCACGYEISRTTVTDAKVPDAHTNLTRTVAVAPDCTNDGNIEYWSCSGCNKIYADAAATTIITDIVDPATDHAYGDFVYDEATGEHKRICANDASHIESEACADVATDEDCLCDDCGHLVAHSWVAATCSAPKTCSVCNATDGEELGHAFNIWEYDEEADEHFSVCDNNDEHILYGTCGDSDEDDDCNCDICDRLMDHDFAPATCIAPKTCRVCEATEGEINPERHIGNSEVKTDEYREATCVSKEYTKYVTYCLGCDEAIDTEEVEGELDPDNHQKKQVVPNGGKDKEHYYICEREGCEYKENIPHDLSNATIVDQPTCTEIGRLREYCSICKSYIYSEIAKIPHVDANKNAKCDVCDTTVELPEDPQPETPTPEPTPTPEDPSANCDCNCHKAGLQGLFFSIILLFQRLLGMNKKCICGVAHY